MLTSEEQNVVKTRRGKMMDQERQPNFSKESCEKKKKKMDHDEHDDDGVHFEKRPKEKVKVYDLVSFWELPDYMKDNEYIIRYYRANWPLKEALFSIFRWHNETLNVWTHLIGFILFLGLSVTNLVEVPDLEEIISLITRSFPISSETKVSHNNKQFLVGATNLAGMKQIEQTVEMNNITPTITPVTRWPFFVFLGGSMFCLLSSSICHLFSCHSQKLNLLLVRIDYTGITVMIITSFFPPIFYIFQCTPHWHFIYLGGITAMGIFTAVTLLRPCVTTGIHRRFRAFLFSSMGLFGIVPTVHALVVNWSNPNRNVTLGYELAMAFFYLTGTVFYVSRVPERWKPGWFDMAGQSHQIFHVFVVLGALAHYGATLLFLEWRDRVGC